MDFPRRPPCNVLPRVAATTSLARTLMSHVDPSPIGLPVGFKAAGVYSGVKRNTSKLDLSLLVSDRPAVAAGVYTQNRVFAAPVALDRARTPSAGMRAIVINSGNANACTGQRGLDDAHEMARLAAVACGVSPASVLVIVDRNYRPFFADGEDFGRASLPRAKSCPAMTTPWWRPPAVC